RDLPAVHRHDLEERRLAAISARIDPVGARDDGLLAGDELEDAHSVAVRPQPRLLVSPLEDRTGLRGASSVVRPLPPEDAPLDAVPLRLRLEQRGERTRIAAVERGVGGPQALDVVARHRHEASARTRTAPRTSSARAARRAG